MALRRRLEAMHAHATAADSAPAGGGPKAFARFAAAAGASAEEAEEMRAAVDAARRGWRGWRREVDEILRRHVAEAQAAAASTSGADGSDDDAAAAAAAAEAAAAQGMRWKALRRLAAARYEETHPGEDGNSEESRAALRAAIPERYWSADGKRISIVAPGAKQPKQAQEAGLEEAAHGCAAEANGAQKKKKRRKAAAGDPCADTAAVHEVEEALGEGAASDPRTSKVAGEEWRAVKKMKKRDDRAQEVSQEVGCTETSGAAAPVAVTKAAGGANAKKSKAAELTEGRDGKSKKPLCKGELTPDAVPKGTASETIKAQRQSKSSVPEVEAVKKTPEAKITAAGKKAAAAAAIKQEDHARSRDADGAVTKSALMSGGSVARGLITQSVSSNGVEAKTAASGKVKGRGEKPPANENETEDESGGEIEDEEDEDEGEDEDEEAMGGSVEEDEVDAYGKWAGELITAAAKKARANARFPQAGDRGTTAASPFKFKPDPVTEPGNGRKLAVPHGSAKPSPAAALIKKSFDAARGKEPAPARQGGAATPAAKTQQKRSDFAAGFDSDEDCGVPEPRGGGGGAAAGSARHPGKGAGSRDSAGGAVKAGAKPKGHQAAAGWKSAAGAAAAPAATDQVSRKVAALAAAAAASSGTKAGAGKAGAEAGPKSVSPNNKRGRESDAAAEREAAAAAKKLWKRRRMGLAAAAAAAIAAANPNKGVGADGPKAAGPAGFDASKATAAHRAAAAAAAAGLAGGRFGRK